MTSMHSDNILVKSSGDADEQLLQLRIAQEANRSKNAFLSRISHEMRTPMNAIIGMAKIAEGTDDVKKLKYCLSTINMSAMHLLELVNDVIDMSRLETGAFALETVPFNVEHMLKKVCTPIVEQMEEKGITFRVSFSGNMGMQYAGDELRLSQVMTSLLTNAVKFTPGGGDVTLAVSELRRGTSSSLLQFRVADTGIGMDAGQVDRIFAAFEQEERSVPRQFGGTGIGLAIAKRIIERMKGALTVTSSLGCGSDFIVTVELPRAADWGDDLAATPVSGLKILVVDPDEISRSTFSFLEADGSNRVDGTGSAIDAAQLVSEAEESNAPYDAIFAAYHLADGTALDLAENLDYAIVMRCFVLTGSFQQWSNIDTEAFGLGIETFVPRPLFPADILGAFRTLARETNSHGGTDTEREETPDFSLLTLLLVEDIPINREVFASLLERTGVQIVSAQNGIEAVEKFHADPGRYDCIIMDIQMPEMDGYQATRAIRALDVDKARSVPIIAMTANVFQEDVEQCLACGMNSHISKPIDVKDVMRKIAHFCS